MSNQNSSLSKNAPIVAYPTIYFNAKECAKHTTHAPEDKDPLGAFKHLLCKRSNKRIKRLIFYISLLNISSILFGAASIDTIGNSEPSESSLSEFENIESTKKLWFDAVNLNSVELVELLLFNMGSKDSEGNTALHIASINGYKDVIELLLKNGADSSAENNNGDKSADLARKNGNFEIAEILDGKPINEKEEKKDNSAIKRHKCDVCPKAFNRSSKLIIHKRRHTGEKPYKCDICNKAFSENGVLMKHKKTHTGEKPYKCDTDGCDYSTSDKSYLIIHKRRHTGEKPYKCAVCNKAFSENGNLVRHKRKHTGKKLYKCDSIGCDYSSFYKSHLVEHKRKHTGEKPYKCNVDGCNYAASHHNYLVLHKKIHMAKELFKMIVDNKKEQVEELLINGANIDAKDNGGCTGLHLAVIMSRKEILETLIEAGADINLQNRRGQTAENLAYDLGNSEFVRILQNAAKELAARQTANKE